MVKLTQTKWKGVVSHRVSTRMTATFAAANTAQPNSSQYLRSLEPIPDISHRLDELGTELRPKPADIDVHHVASRIEGVAPHVCQPLFPGTHLARLPHQVLEDEELTLGEVHGPGVRVGHPTKEVQADPPSRQQTRRGRRLGLTKPGPHPGQKLGEREGLGEVICSAELQTTHLRVHIRQSRQDQNSLLGSRVDDGLQDGDAVQSREKQVQDDELVPAAPGQLESPNPVMGTVHPESLRRESPRDEAHDPRLVVDHEDSGHSKRILRKVSSGGFLDDETVTYPRGGCERTVTV